MFGIKALAYNADTLTKSRKTGPKLDVEVAEGEWLLVCVDPEHLKTKIWTWITDQECFRRSITLVTVDEAHLIFEWGEDFRVDFKHIGPFCRGCLPPRVSVGALSATLQTGARTKHICNSLGFRDGHFVFIRRSNERPNMQFSLKTLTHGLGGDQFPDLLPYLNSNRKAVVYGKSIDICFRMYLFALRCSPNNLKRHKRFRLYHALCWSVENAEIVRLIRDDPECQVVFATIAFGQGFNIKSLLDIYQPDFPTTVDQAKQNDGRGGRDPSTIGRSIIFVPAKSVTTAQKVVEGILVLCFFRGSPNVAFSWCGSSCNVTCYA